jgi:hypothetical protein
MYTKRTLLRFEASGSDGRLYHLAAVALDGPSAADTAVIGYALADGRRVIQTDDHTFALEGGALTFRIEP